jgi:hypothetical protein
VELITDGGELASATSERDLFEIVEEVNGLMPELRARGVAGGIQGPLMPAVVSRFRPRGLSE